MQTLGLSSESKRSDGRLKSIFWPTVENAWDVNYLGQQGFWICVIVGLLQALVGVFSGNPVLLVAYVAMALVFLAGGMGVREANWPAAAMVFALFFCDILYTLAVGRLPGILTIVCAGILLSNVRAAFLASEWRPAQEGEDRPTRFNESFRDRLVEPVATQSLAGSPGSLLRSGGAAAAAEHGRRGNGALAAPDCASRAVPSVRTDGLSEGRARYHFAALNGKNAALGHKVLREWWPGTGLNRRRRPFQGRALPLSYLASIETIESAQIPALPNGIAGRGGRFHVPCAQNNQS